MEQQEKRGRARPKGSKNTKPRKPASASPQDKSPGRLIDSSTVPATQAAWANRHNIRLSSHGLLRCLVCHERRRVHIHHIDGDKWNNDPINIAPLCPTHHDFAHHCPDEDSTGEHIEKWQDKIRHNPMLQDFHPTGVVVPPEGPIQSVRLRTLSDAQIVGRVLATCGPKVLAGGTGRKVEVEEVRRRVALQLYKMGYEEKLEEVMLVIRLKNPGWG